MGIKPSSIQDLGSILPPQWVTRMGSSRINRTATGSFTAIPSPPAGKLRMVVDWPQGGMNSMALVPAGQVGLRLWGSDGVTMGPQNGSLTFDATVSVQGRTFSPSNAPSYTLSGFENGFLYLAPGESVQVNITAFNGGTTKVVGIAAWIDFDATDVIFVRQVFNDTSLKTIVPAVPAGKIAVAYMPGNSLSNNFITFAFAQALFWNPDTVTHNWDAVWSDPAGGSLTQTGFMSVGGPGGYGLNLLFGYYSMILLEGQSLSLKIQEAVSTDPPVVSCLYKLIDSV